MRGIMQRPCHGPHDIHACGDGPGVVADKGDLAVALVGRAVNSTHMLPGLVSKAADLVSSGWREAAVNVLVEEHLHAVALDEEGVVVISPLLPFTQPLTVLWLRGPSAGRPARRAAQVVDATLFLRVLQSLQERTPTTATGTTGVYHTQPTRGLHKYHSLSLTLPATPHGPRGSFSIAA